jgi:signal transduction histidine kinase
MGAGGDIKLPHHDRRENIVITILIVLSSLIILILDLQLPRGYGVSFLYLIPLTLSTLLRERRVTIAIALVAISAIVAGFFLSPPGFLYPSIFNLIFSIIMVIIATYFVLRRLRDEQKIYEQAIRAEEQRRYLERVINTIPIPIIIYNAQSLPEFSNPPAQELWMGKLPQPRQGIDGTVLRRGTEDAITPEEYTVSRLLRGMTIQDEQVDVLFSNEIRKTLLVYAAPIIEKDDDLVGGVVAYLDITEITRLRDELLRSNEDLQHFAYAASHDLKQPLTTIVSYLELLKDRYSGKVLDEKASRYIENAVSGGRQMAELIDSLLQFSRITGIEETIAPTDLDEVMHEVENNLTSQISESGAIVTHDPLPTINTNFLQMIHVFQNLVSNGIKYRGTEIPHVHVSASKQADGWLFSVVDNGIGIDQKYADKLFKMFSRLHTKEEYPGTGMGLAITKKIVERHGGRIWFESEPGKGTAFYFTIPA